MAEKKESSTAAKSIKSFLSGGFGGMCLVAVGHPLDLIKVRLQATSQYKGTWDCAKQTFIKEGIRGLYRGMLTPLIGVTPIFAICFWGYDLGQQICRWSSGMGSSEKLSLGQIMFAGGFSAIPTTVLMTPTERIKVVLQVQGTNSASKIVYKGPIQALKGILAEGGIRSLYRGTWATLLRDGPGSVAYFGAYEVIKKALTPQGKDPSQLSPLAVLTAGGFAGIANWAVAIPPDVIKSKLQSAPTGTYSGFMDCVSKTVQADGPTALFKGLGPAMIRAFPANAACFFGVEVSKKFLDQLM